MIELIEVMAMAKYEFCLTAQDQLSPWREDTQIVSVAARSEHAARLRIVRRCLLKGLWVVLLLSFDDLTK